MPETGVMMSIYMVTVRVARPAHTGGLVVSKKHRAAFAVTITAVAALLSS
jgi:hypothetical protein